ncbi:MULTISPECIES: cation:proton antiporter regulatory subunit [Paenarthrobacter]|jgi:TrkA domain protein|uniref:TrkA domain protein n=2 Tax=Paenarthrobacter TaxID=1742992 RepID=A0ABT9TRA0_PAENI|nr:MULTISPECIES: cation:proton antiporter regulatory subunit [Paenarthrobacter]KQR06963.1 potassium transporter TrkA [Arthrobacter sp. Leaf145]SKB76422.1 potassium/proton antiporter regulatory subunit, CPA2 family [Arthrobacter sp. 31Cvi3.1E]BCW12324.1 potassium transporter TrkA [Arthrobacter sp. NtRootA2]BCW16406.1 potassium transporter TrkA [Arthrobacter sp. NtRootA4]BCW24739.1 potassium transporter TrkA [Arthrobacter sp. NtRootC7]BCW29009.1 potassium transporter TrkA [Arthrobacter sp. NtRo
MNVDETELPGLGIRKDFVTASGRRIGVVELREGETELFVSTWDDPDTCQASIPLTADEASTLGNLLGGQHIAMRLAEAHREVPGIVTRQFSITADSPFVNQAMGKAQIRTRSGVSIVAIMREGEVVPSPAPDVVLHTGDLLVAVGTQEGLDSAADILRNG